MATPTAFVSSTFYDLRYVREGIKRFIEGLGYTAVLSEEGTVFFDPGENAADACLAEVGNADMLVVIIGGRYGSPMPAGDQSVTNAEYQQAVRKKIPVFALVEHGTFNDYHVFRANADKPDVLDKIRFPHADPPESSNSSTRLRRKQQIMHWCRSGRSATSRTTCVPNGPA